MEKKLFCLKDNISNDIIISSLNVNCAEFIRSTLPVIISNYPLKDLEIIESGIIETTTGEILTTSKTTHSWDEYKFPENKSENLAPLGADVNKIFQKFSEKTSDIKE